MIDDPTSHPTEVGPYEILEVLGEGGMGTVYLAEQREPLVRRVALKVIKLGMDSRAVLRRFETERAALARMSHDNIARVFDAGTTPTGQPYFVMEHVDGAPFTTYCDKNQLTTNERLALFAQVCAGVQHAHVKGVLHRDLKPTNVLVTTQDGRGVPKIIDFGLARATEREDREETVVTEHGQILGTPEYMSPEQADFANDDVDARTDVYSLGALLYETLVGSPPITREELMAFGVLEGLRRIRDDDAPRPSTRLNAADAPTEVADRRRTTTVSLIRELRGDLDWILLRALEKDRDRRYQSAEGLAEDVARYLGHEPIRARPPSPLYRLQKFVRRNRGRVAAFAALFVALVIGLVSFAFENRRARANALAAETARGAAEVARGAAEEARGVAEERLQLAMDAVEAYFTGVTEDVLLQQPELADLRKELLATPIGFYHDLRESLAASETSQNDRARLALALGNLGVLTNAIGSPEEAHEVLSEGIALRRELALDPQPSPTSPDPLGEVHRRAVLELLLEDCRVLRILGRREEASERARELADEAGQGSDASRWRATATEELAAIARSDGRFDEAEGLLQTGLELRKAEAEQSPGQLRAMAATTYALAETYAYSKDLESAEEAFRAALATQLRVLEEGTYGADLRYDTALTHRGLARTLTDRARYDEAIQEQTVAIELCDALIAEQPAVSSFKSGRASAQQDLALTYAYAGRFDEARATYQQAIDAFGKLSEEHASVPLYRHAEARAQQNLAELLGRMNLHDEATPHAEEAVASLEYLARQNPDDVEVRKDMATSANTLAVLHQALEHYDDAEEAYTRTAQALEQLLAETPDSTMFRSRLCATQYNLGQLAERREQLEEALALYDTALATALGAGDDPEDRLTQIILTRAAHGRADALSRLERFDESLAAWDVALAHEGDGPGRLQLEIVRLTALARSGRSKSARAELDEILTTSTELTADHHVYAALVLAQLHHMDLDDASADYAIELLFQARDGRAFDNPYRLSTLRSDPLFDPLREHPGFVELSSPSSSDASQRPPRGYSCFEETSGLQAIDLG